MMATQTTLDTNAAHRHTEPPSSELRHASSRIRMGRTSSPACRSIRYQPPGSEFSYASPRILLFQARYSGFVFTTRESLEQISTQMAQERDKRLVPPALSVIHYTLGSGAPICSSVSVALMVAQVLSGKAMNSLRSSSLRNTGTSCQFYLTLTEFFSLAQRKYLSDP
ncbi:hypothetical protein BC834DRAFT_59840 [Gloeopeniophorella convolvens]|nr:hypothetical protein BC834DRAFT_59840 [Gloeopeniophorella convolvens]